jgi:hypothetical protein
MSGSFVLRAVEVVSAAGGRASTPRATPCAAPWRTARRTWTRPRCSRLCRPGRRRAAPPSSPRSACRGPSGGSGRGRRGRAPAGATTRQSSRGCASVTGPGRWGRRPWRRRPWSPARSPPAGEDAAEHPAGDLLAGAAAVGVGGVEERDAGVGRLADDRLGFRLLQRPRSPGLLAAEAHHAQAQPGHLQAALSESHVLHDPFLPPGHPLSSRCIDHRPRGLVAG